MAGPTAVTRIAGGTGTAQRRHTLRCTRVSSPVKTNAKRLTKNSPPEIGLLTESSDGSRDCVHVSTRTVKLPTWTIMLGDVPGPCRLLAESHRWSSALHQAASTLQANG